MVKQHPANIKITTTSSVDDQFNDAEYQIKIRLIDEIQYHPCIYDKAHKDHFQCDKKLEIFGTIGSLLNLDGKPLISMILSRKSITFLPL